MKKLRENKGITLVALIVTIIILLILAGVTIALLNGEDGILSRAEKAATSYEIESVKEVVNLKLANLNASKWIDEGRKAVLKDLNELDNENSENFDGQISLKSQVQDSDSTAILVYDNHEIEVNSNLTITKIDGIGNLGTTGNTNGEQNGSGDSNNNSGNSSIVDSTEYIQMQATIAQLQEEVSELKNSKTQAQQERDILKNSLTEANSKIDSAQNQIDNMLTTLDVDTRTTLFEGSADTLNTTYSISNILDYKYIIVYTDFYRNRL